MQVEGRETVGFGLADGRGVRTPGTALATLKVSAERTGGAYSLFEVEVGPGAGEPPHVQHRDDECLCVLEGRFEVLIEDELFEAGPGSVIYVPKGTLHAFEKANEGPGRLLAIHTPGGSHESFVEEVAAAGAHEQAAGGLVEIAARHGVEMCETGERGERGER